MTKVRINERLICSDAPTYIIAELSGNHHQDFGKAIELIHAAKDAGANAIKIQTYTADTITLNVNREEFRIGKGTLWEGKSLHALYEEAHTPWDWQPKLKKEANSLGMDLFSTPFDDTAVDFLEKELDPPAYKIASFEVVDIPLVRKIAERKKPIIMSTGMASVKEIQEAVDAIRSAGNNQIVLLKCTSAYPTLPEDSHLRTIGDLQKRFGVPVGLSDHTLGIAVPIAAVALGACVIEKHFCMNRSEPGPDSAFSLEPHEFKEMVESVRITEKALGCVSYGQTASEKQTALFRRSLYVTQDILKGERFTVGNVRSVRPCNGLPPKELDNVLNKTARKDISMGTPLSWDLVS